MNVRPVITSVGPPPEKHADRVVAEMLRWTVSAQTRRWDKIKQTIESRFGADGNPRAQAKLAKLIEKDGGLFFNSVLLKPGKRGRYEIYILEVSGWNPIDNKIIESSDQIPEKPWLCFNSSRLCSEGRGRYGMDSATIIAVTHHSLSRLAQRCGAKTPRDLLLAVHSIGISYIDMAYPVERERSPRRVLPDDYRLKFELGKVGSKEYAYAVLKKLESDKKTMVVTTIIGDEP